MVDKFRTFFLEISFNTDLIQDVNNAQCSECSSIRQFIFNATNYSTYFAQTKNKTT